jgi:hypothetical protein
MWPRVREYDTALLVDVDCVFRKSPADLLDAIPRDADLAVKLERSFPMNSQYHARGYFVEAELADQRARGIDCALNAGTFGFAIDDAHLSMLETFHAWMLACMARKRWFYDQTFFCIHFASKNVSVTPLTAAVDLGHREPIFHAVGDSASDKIKACREVIMACARP